ncbi:YceI family protein [Candidatus Marinimicrobia bacterium]|nr:YceI family protein [Candidatus Neomarinimicrobiota bacterium]MDC0878115.1 YceI family protein [Candidatus Neomarinimicrobiota bacterium]MDC1000610.1 YceI family protein [Candidatus Neomarinimicrobiota bacterium]
MKKLIIILFFQVVFAQGVPVSIDVEQSFISYDGRHPAHNWTGISKEIKGSFIFDKDNPTSSNVDLFVPVFSFDSKNSNRDSNMLDVIEDYFYPTVSFTSSKITKEDNGYSITGILFFHGVQKEITIPVNFILDDKKIIVDADFSVSLSDYKIKRPSLLTIKMKDDIEIKFFLIGSI